MFFSKKATRRSNDEEDTCSSDSAALAIPAFGTQITAPGDPLIGGQFDDASNAFNEGIDGFAGGQNNWPGGEAPEFAVDGSAQKYLNFGINGTGILISPASGECIVAQFTVYTANDAIERDPTSYVILGSNDPSVHASNFNSNTTQDTVDLSSFSLVNGGPLNLPDTGPSMSRNLGGVNDPISDATFFTTTTFDNIQTACTYVIIFLSLIHI